MIEGGKPEVRAREDLRVGGPEIGQRMGTRGGEDEDIQSGWAEP